MLMIRYKDKIYKIKAETTIEGRRGIKQFVSGDTSIQLPLAPDPDPPPPLSDDAGFIVFRLRGKFNL